ncbi:MAG TPA: hypothetical protein VGR35_01890 [Tepidisphaeraceae bacterium]|nr:hypothetical protein [Tepidisphaeraceae bacterium]
MSQYPSPYTPPPQQPSYGGGYDFNYYQPTEDVLAPARRSSVMMFIMGGLLAIGGLCCGAMGALVPFDQVMAQNPVLSSGPGMTADLLKFSVIVVGVLSLLFGMALLVLGYFVRSGGMVPIVIAIVLVGLALLLGMGNLLIGALQIRAAGPEMMMGLCMNLIPLVLLGVLLFMLVRAAKAAPRVTAMKSQYQQHYWHYQQQQQMYQTGYPAPPPMTPPTAPPDDPSRGDPHGPGTQG